MGHASCGATVTDIGGISKTAYRWVTLKNENFQWHLQDFQKGRQPQGVRQSIILVIFPKNCTGGGAKALLDPPMYLNWIKEFEKDQDIEVVSKKKFCF